MQKAVLTALLVLAAMPLYAQQDPEDPGIQDSIIISSLYDDTSRHNISVTVWAVTDDSVTYYNIPLTWFVEEGSAHGDSVRQYLPPLNSWDVTFDSTMTNPDYMRIIGFCDLMEDSVNYPIVTNGRRQHIMTLSFTVEYAPSLWAVIDTTYDNRNGSLLLGLSDGLREITPAFKRGYIGIRVGIGESDPVSAFALSQNYPNPFNPETKIEFSQPTSERVSIMVYDLLGREVRRLIDASLEPGYHAVIWDGRDNTGSNVPSGMYFYRLASAGFSDTKKMLLLR